jgi:hypothetical protein
MLLLETDLARRRQWRREGPFQRRLSFDPAADVANEPAEPRA